MKKNTEITCTLEEFKAKGILECNHGTQWDCAFVVEWLLNGRLRVTVTPVKYTAHWERILKNCDHFLLTGENNKGRVITASDIHLTNLLYPPNQMGCVLQGYAQKATIARKYENQPEKVTVRCELTNLHFVQQLKPIQIELDNRQTEIGFFRRWEHAAIKDHSYAYQHAIIAAYLEVPNVPTDEQAEIADHVSILTLLLSLAQRSHVFVAAKHYFDRDTWLRSEFQEPTFMNLGWPRALISDTALKDFLHKSYLPMTLSYQEWDLGTILDHYLQSLSLRSAWPSSLGIFTAIEGLKSAFFHKQSNTQNKSHVVNHDNFKQSKPLFDEIRNVLIQHFPEFQKHVDGQDSYLERQIVALNERPFTYREQLQLMLDQLQVPYTESEVKAFIKIRNSIVHRATPAEYDSSPEKYDVQVTEGWEQVQQAANLLEKILLALLGYDGERELLSEGQNI